MEVGRCRLELEGTGGGRTRGTGGTWGLEGV